MSSPCADQLHIDTHQGPRADLRHLFELAEDSVVQLESYLGLGEVLAAYDGSAVIGHLQLVPTAEPDEIEIKSLAVLPERQGHGVGTALIAAAVERCAAAGMSRMVVSTAAAGISNLRFYQRAGFRLESVEQDAFTPATGYPNPIMIDGIMLRDRVWFARELAVGLPGEDTMLACWRALAQMSAEARVVTYPLAHAAIFPAWAPLNNAIATSVASRDSAAVQMAACYRAAGVQSWALWLPSRRADLDTPDQIEQTALLRRDITTLVMHSSLPESLPRHSQVVRTSIASATLEAPLRADELDPPETVPGLDGWVFVHEGAAIAGAWSYLHGTDCGVYAVETLPRWRRRGFARALVEHVLADAHAAGARTATLQSTPMGQQLYERLGFTAVGRYEEWVPR